MKGKFLSDRREKNSNRHISGENLIKNIVLLDTLDRIVWEQHKGLQESFERTSCHLIVHVRMQVFTSVQNCNVGGGERLGGGRKK